MNLELRLILKAELTGIKIQTKKNSIFNFFNFLTINIVLIKFPLIIFRLSVLGAITSVQQRLKLYNKGFKSF